MVSMGVPLDPKERVIASLENVALSAYVGKTTLGRDIRVYFGHGSLSVNLSPWGNVAYCDDFDEGISLEKALFLEGFRFAERTIDERS